MNDLEIGQNIANVNNLEKEQNKFLETTLGKTINTAVNIGLRWVLPDLIEDEIINIKDSLVKGGLKQGINTAIKSVIICEKKRGDYMKIDWKLFDDKETIIEKKDKLVKYENNWKAYYKDKNLNGMEKEYRKINEKLKELMPFETALKQARQIENLHKIIKNNGGDFNLTQEQIELSKMLV